MSGPGVVLGVVDDPNAWRLARVRSVTPETAKASTVRFEVPGWPGHLAGQRIDIRLTAEDGYSTTRAYSMSAPWTETSASSATERSDAPGGPTVDVTVEELDDGEVSPYLVRELRPGDELELRGPIGGAFTWTPGDGGPLLLVAGGSGVVPLMAMVRAYAAARIETDVSMILSARTAADLLFHDELRRLAAAGTIAFHPTLTRDTPPGWTGGTGRVDLAFLSAHGPSPAADPRIFVCGSNAFVETAVGALLSGGHDARAIRTERFGPAAG